MSSKVAPREVQPLPANEGWTLLQYIESGDCEMLEFLHKTGDYPDLQAPGDTGCTPAYLAILHDQPDVLRKLHYMKVDMSKKCDPMQYGTPAYYCFKMGRTACLKVLSRLGYDLECVCNKVGEKPKKLIEKYNPPPVAEEMWNIIQSQKDSAAERIQSLLHFRRAQTRVKEEREKQEAGEMVGTEGHGEGADEAAENYEDDQAYQY